MNDTQVTLRTGTREIALIGTAHISKESIVEVSREIETRKPDMVCVELDSARYNSMMGNDAWQKLDIIKTIREGKGFLLIANLVLSSFQRRMGNTIGVKPGDEMKSAVKTADALGIPYTFCDREVQITLRRAWAQCGLWSRCKLLSVLLSSVLTNEKLSEEEVEKLKKSSELDSMMNELAAFLPPVKKTLIDERDYYLAAKIWEASENKTSTAAIVGAGHVRGIEKYIKEFSNYTDSAANSTDANPWTQTAALEVVPPPGVFSKISGWIIPAFIVVFVAMGLVFADFSQVGEGLLRWLLWNGSLAALGAALALAHPLAILISFIGAPIGTLSPVISVGLFSGLAQAYLRRPQIKDAETLVDDAVSIKGIYRNRITHILLVFFLASLGGVIGNIISITSIAGLFAKFFHS